MNAVDELIRLYAKQLKIPLQNIRKFCGRQTHPPDFLTCCWNS